MKAYPIIHARTFFSDFPTGLLVCPEVFGTNEVETSRKFILNATKNIDCLSGIRRVLFSVGDYSVLGLVGFIKDIAENDKAAEKYSRDSFNRKLYAFIGYVVARKDLNGIYVPLIDPEEMIKLYISKMSNDVVWKSETPTTFMSEAINNIPTKKVDFSNDKNDKMKKIYYSCSEEMNAELFEKCVMICKKDNRLSLCTNFCDPMFNYVFKVISIKGDCIDDSSNKIADDENNSDIDNATISIGSAITAIAGVLAAISLIGSKIYSFIKKK